MAKQLKQYTRLSDINVEAGAAIAALVAFRTRWSRSCRRTHIAAVAQVGLIVIGWGIAQYSYLVRPEVMIFNRTSPPNIFVDMELSHWVP